MTENSVPVPSGPSAIPAGWYPDPRGSKQRRWWDGAAWTHALEPLAPTEPAYANLPGPTVSRAPSPSAPTVRRAIVSEPEAVHQPTRRQLRDAAAVLEMQRQLTDPTPAPSYAMGGDSAAQQTPASYSLEQFRTASEQESTGGGSKNPQITKNPAKVIDSRVVSTIAPTPVTEAPVHTFAQTFAPVPAAAPVSANTFAAPEQAEPETVAPETEAQRSARVQAEQQELVRAEMARLEAVRAEEAALIERAEIVRLAALERAERSREAAAALTTEFAVSAPVSAASASTASASTTTAAPDFSPLELNDAAQTLIPAVTDQYQPFGMNPRVRTGVVGPPTLVSTAAAWLFSLLPIVFVGAEYALATYLPEFHTTFSQGAIAFVIVISAIFLAFADRRQLVRANHRVTASPLWVVFTPLVYLFARAIRTTGQAGKAGASWAPAIVFLLVAAAGAAAFYLTPLSTGLIALFA